MPPFLLRVRPAVLLAALSACSAGESPDAFPSSGSGAGPGAGNATAAGSAGALVGGGGAVTGGAGGAGGTLIVGSGGTPAAGGLPGVESGGSAGASACNPPNDVASPETCDGLDNDLDGFVDEAGCPCNVGSTQPCFAGPPSQSSLANCRMGTQRCVQAGEFSEWGPCADSGCGEVVREEICDNASDDDCDGLVDEGCYLDAVVNLDGDCLSAFCPAQAPNPIGCNITMEGGDSRGCVSHAPGSSEVYFQEGNACPLCLPPLIPCAGGAGRVSGTLRCSSDLAPVPLDATNCVINKAAPSYPTPQSTPITQPVSGCAQ